MEHSPRVVVIELGSQYTLLIARTLRELGVRSVILEPKRALNWLKAIRPKPSFSPEGLQAFIVMTRRLYLKKC